LAVYLIIVAIILAGRFADRDTWIPQRCPVAKALEAIGPPSAVLVLREAYFGTSRFDDYVRRLGMTESAVTVRLRQLVDAGLLIKEPYKRAGQRTRYDYHLTQMGRDLMPALISLMEWGDTYLQDDRGRAVCLTHAECGEPVAAQVRCAAGHHVGPDEIVMRPAENRST
jgi:DNA-binding HxlR family transcriptional regulator